MIKTFCVINLARVMLAGEDRRHQPLSRDKRMGPTTLAENTFRNSPFYVLVFNAIMHNYTLLLTVNNEYLTTKSVLPDYLKFFRLHLYDEHCLLKYTTGFNRTRDHA